MSKWVIEWMSEAMSLFGLKTLSRLRLFVDGHCSDPGVCYSSPGARATLGFLGPRPDIRRWPSSAL